MHHHRYGDIDVDPNEHEYACEQCMDQGCGLCTDLEAQARDDELGAESGDPRRCPRHPNVKTSSPDGMFDAPCGACEEECDLAAERWTYESPTRAIGFCAPPAHSWGWKPAWRLISCLDTVEDPGF